MRGGRVISIIVCAVLLFSLSAPAALAGNVWNLPSGMLLKAVRENERYNGYSALTYLKLQDSAAAVMANRDHALLLFACKQDGKTVLLECQTAVRQPGETDYKKVQLVGNGDSYMLCYPGTTLHIARQGTRFYLGSVYLDTLTMLPCERNGKAGWYLCNDGSAALSWHPGQSDTEPLPFEQVNLRFFPRTLADVAALQALDDAQVPALPGGESISLPAAKELAPVYSAPGSGSVRFADGKASVDLRSPFTLLGFTPDGEWALISYEVSAQARRVGYINGKLLDGIAQQSTLSLASLPASVTQDTYLTDDPDVSQAARMQLKAGDSVTLLALYGPWYAYVETMLEGQAVRGFVPRACLRCPALTEEAPEAAARLVGEWEFIGGGEMLGDYVNFQSDGRAAANWVPPAEMEKLSDAEREEYGEPGWATYQVYQCTERETANYWSGCEYILVIRNDAGYIVGLYGLIFNTTEDGRESFALYFGEGGGNYARYDGGTSQ